MGVIVPFTKKEIDHVLEIVYSREREAEEYNRKNYLTPGINQLAANIFGVKGEYAVAKALNLDRKVLAQNGVSWRVDLVLQLRGRKFKIEVKSPLGRDRRLALPSHHGKADLKSDVYILVWPAYDMKQGKELKALFDPMEIMGFCSKGTFMEKGQWVELRHGKQFMVTHNDLRPISDFMVPLNYWPLEGGKKV